MTTETAAAPEPTTAPTADPVVLDYNACQTLHDAASSEVSRPTLQYARIAEGRGEATNGHILFRVPLTFNYPRPWPEGFTGERYLHRETLALVKSGGRLELDMATGAVQLVDRKGLSMALPDGVAPATLPGGAPYPDTDKVVPKYDATDGVRFALSGAYMRVLSDLAKRCNPETHRVTLHVNDPERALLVEVRNRADDTVVSGVVMPLHILD